ncbi:MAG TPA: glycoside hydrolase family 15 protein [Chloroflexota bacterium]
MTTPDYCPIADYALIGDCHTAALVSKQGSIDWYCPCRFDEAAVLCRLLDARKGGYFSIAPEDPFSSSHRYRGDSNVLETTFRCESGAEVLLTDFMPIYRRTQHRLGHDVGTTRQILRMVEGGQTPCSVEARFKPTFDFARGQTELRLAPGKGAIARQGQHRLVLYGPKLEDVSLEAGVFRGRLDLRPGEHSWLVLSYASSELGVQDALEPDVSVQDLRRTLEYWKDWIGCCRYKGPYQEAVFRSALTLKLLIHEPTGAVVAAPTTSVPELIGGVRNWDYRYTWLRDASLMLYALSTLGFHEEATDYINWLAETCGGDPEVRPQIMYTVDGSRDLPERELGHLEGYRGSGPVRVGNAASNQHQLDIFGDIMAAAYHFRHTVEADDSVTPVPAPHQRLSRRNWRLLTGFVEQAAAEWQDPDSGIWEVRGDERQFTYSKVMCWVALDRGIRLAEEQRLRAPLDRWRKICGDIRTAILERGWNEKLGAFTQVLDGHELDASVLAMSRYGLLAASDRRVQSTVDRIREQLTRNGLVERYHAPDGLPGSEGTFALCSFWMVDALALGGRIDEARELYERLLTYRNDVGLLSEEIEPTSTSDRLLGNFPQGFSHMALIGSAMDLMQAELAGPEHRPHTDAERAVKAAVATAGGG